MIDPTAATFGLPPCLRIPIAADSVASIRTFVGIIVQLVDGDPGKPNALSVRPFERLKQKSQGVKLWKEPNAAEYELRLHPEKQVWVHVDFNGYRKAYQDFDMPPIPPGYFLDHVQNRKAIRLRHYSHPYLRLCPVMRSVNTSGGSAYGGEGMEKEYLKTVQGYPPGPSSKIIYADPMDLTKMLNFPPGTQVLAGVGQLQRLFYAK
jgi:hypothetical protein